MPRYPLPSRRRVLLRTALVMVLLAALAAVVGRAGLAGLTGLTTGAGLDVHPEAGLVALAATGADLALLAIAVVVVRTGLRLAGDLGHDLGGDLSGTSGAPSTRSRLERVVAGVLLGAGALAPQLASAAPVRDTSIAMPAADSGPVDPTYLGPLSTPTATQPPRGYSQAAPAATATVTVRPGDTLWAIAERTARRARPAADADDAAVARTVLALYAANRAVIGDDPDLITPGTRLALPDTNRKTAR